MRTIIIDDEQLMLHRFVRLGHDIPDLDIIEQFTNAKDALNYLEHNTIDLVCMDIFLPGMDGIVLSRILREKYPRILIVYVSAFETYLREFNQIGGDYYILKPYTKNTLELMMDRMRLLRVRQYKEIFIQTFGRFLVYKNNKPVPLVGKYKEILALLVSRRGKEISNEEIFTIIWENECCTHDNMKTYFNALRRLKTSLAKYGLEQILISTSRGQLVDTKQFDCDYYSWLDGSPDERSPFEGEFLTEYSWGESLLSNLLFQQY